MRKGMLTDEFQAARSVPKDRRISLPVKVDSEVMPTLALPAPGNTSPNWTYGKAGDVPSPASQPVNPQLGYRSAADQDVTPRRQPLTPEDVSAKVSFPNDKVKAEYVRLQQEMAVNQAKQEALSKLGNHNVNSMFDNMGPQDLSKQGGALKNIMEQKKLEMENAALIDRMSELTDRYSKKRPTSRGYTQGSKTRDFQRGLLTDLGEPK
jgi:hypothetical protein